jgi:hypothetical protein
MLWALVSSAGFVLAVGVVIVLGRARTARWEQERAAEDEELRRRLARQRARTARSAMVATSSVHRRRSRTGVSGRRERQLPE